MKVKKPVKLKSIPEPVESFITWLSRQSGRPDRVGCFAKDIVAFLAIKNHKLKTYKQIKSLLVDIYGENSDVVKSLKMARAEKYGYRYIEGGK